MDRLTYVGALCDTYRTARQGQAGVARRQQQRLHDIVAYARAHSPYYRRLYRDVPERLSEIGQLPVVTKAELMSHFDDWVTDPSVTRARDRGVPRPIRATSGATFWGAMWCVRPLEQPAFRRSCCTITPRWSSTTCWAMPVPCRRCCCRRGPCGHCCAGVADWRRFSSPEDISWATR